MRKYLKVLLWVMIVFLFASFVSASKIISQDVFNGYRILSSTGKEDYWLDAFIEKNVVCFELKTKESYIETSCDLKGKICTKKTTPYNPIFSTSTEISILNVIGDMYCVPLVPFVDMYYKFGSESIIIVGDTSYNSTDVNITQETGFAHLNISDSNVSLYMPFDDNVSNTTSYDYSLNNYDGTFVGQTYYNYTSSHLGYSIYMEGSKDYIALPSTFTLPSTGWTVSMWVYPRAYKDSYVMVAGNHGNGDFIGHIMTGGGNMRVYSAGNIYDIPSVLILNQWQHWVVVANGTDVSFYRNGTFVGSKTFAGDLDVGYIGSGYSDQFVTDGNLDSVIVLNRSLSNTEILNMYNDELQLFYPQGQMLFQNIDLGTNDTANITLNDCQQLNGTNLSASFNGEAQCSFDSNCITTNCDIGSPANDANLTIHFKSNDDNSYSPLIIGNITIDSNIYTDYPDNATPPIINYSNQTIEVGYNFLYDFNASDANGIDAWSLNGTTFKINSSGHIQNNSVFSVGLYYSNVSVNDTYGNTAWVIFFLNVTADVTNPSVTLNSPNVTSAGYPTEFSCTASDHVGISNVSLWHNSTGWHRNQTNSSGVNYEDYIYTNNLNENVYIWNCYACDTSYNCAWAVLNNTFAVTFAAFNYTVENIGEDWIKLNLRYRINKSQDDNASNPAFDFSINSSSSEQIRIRW